MQIKTSLTEHLTFLGPQIPLIGEFNVVTRCQFTDLEALNLWKVRSGGNGTFFNRFFFLPRPIMLTSEN